MSEFIGIGKTWTSVILWRWPVFLNKVFNSILSEWCFKEYWVISLALIFKKQIMIFFSNFTKWLMAYTSPSKRCSSNSYKKINVPRKFHIIFSVEGNIPLFGKQWFMNCRFWMGSHNSLTSIYDSAQTFRRGNAPFSLTHNRDPILEALRSDAYSALRQSSMLKELDNLLAI